LGPHHLLIGVSPPKKGEKKEKRKRKERNQNDVKHGNTLQLTATHCNTLQLHSHDYRVSTEGGGRCLSPSEKNTNFVRCVCIYLSARGVGDCREGVLASPKNAAV